MKLGLLVSGNLGLIMFESLKISHQICFVLTDSKSTKIVSTVSKAGIPLFVGNPRGKDVFSILKSPDCDLILSINYLFLVTNDIFTYPKLGAINFHGSLLPKFRGRTPHIWAIINNETETGVTAHYIDNGCDTGDIIKQIKIPIKLNQTGNDILLIFNSIYPTFVQSVLDDIINDKITRKSQNNELATEFGKRVPEDGLIDWNWQKERIYNWVRALSNPYPGAFSFIFDEKIIINQIAQSDFGFNANQTNGEIIAIKEGKPIVKTPNGSIAITNFSFPSQIQIGQILK